MYVIQGFEAYHRKEVCVLVQNNAIFMTCDRLEANDNQTSRL